ncbi:MAG TPA: hypothetical protein VM425_21780 [Myxococcota bacterium]|nr:hypothetical protein [Myxococcota bacterium]
MALLLVIAQAGTPKGTAETAAAQTTAADVANEFLLGLANAEIDKLLALGGDPFDFDGEQARGAKEIEAFWKRFLKRNRASLGMLQSGEINVIGYTEALKRFGPAPKKFAHLALKRCKFAVVSFRKRNGLMLILAPTKLRGTLGHRENRGWQVVAATD